MLCMLCGIEMDFVGAEPGEAVLGPGFQYRTFQCKSCEDVERRLTFVRRAASAAAPLPREEVASMAMSASAVATQATPRSDGAAAFAARAMAMATALAALPESRDPSTVSEAADVAVTMRQRSTAERSWALVSRRRSLGVLPHSQLLDRLTSTE
jgi:hypothetical protein